MLSQVEERSKFEIWDYSLLLGFLIGLIPSVSGLPTISILLISTYYTFKNRGSFQLIISLPVYQYLIVQFSINWWHSANPFSIDIQNYYVLLILALPIIQYFVSNFRFDVDRLLLGLSIGLFGSVAILMVDYYSVWNGYTCRGNGLQVNPLRAAIFFVPLAGLVVAMDACKKQFSFISAILIACIFVYSGALTGSRMTFYSAIIITFMMAIFFLKKSQYSNFVKILLSALIGVAAIFVIEAGTKCDFAQRLSRNFEFISSMSHSGPEKVEVENPSAVTSNCHNQSAAAATCEVEESATLSAKDPAEAVSKSSEGTRARLWKNAINSFLMHPFIGTGAASEEQQIQMQKVQPGLQGGGAHNQYLSWALWGGIISIVSGLGLFLTHFLCNRSAFPAAIFLSSFAVSSMAMSSLVIGGAMAEFVLLLVVVSPILGEKMTVFLIKIGRP